MRRRVGFALVFVGLFLLFTAVGLRVWAYPRLQKAPLDQYATPVATGTGTYFNLAQRKEVEGAPLKSVRVVRGDVRAGSSDVAVWDSFVSIVDTSDDGVITATQERVALDRVSAVAVHCCGEHPRHDGLTLKFPFNVEQRDYDAFWDGPANRAYPARFKGEETIEGLKVYRFEQSFDRVKTRDLPVSGEMAGEPTAQTVPASVLYGNTKTLWVEPATGAIVKGQQAIRQVVETASGRQVLTVLDATLTYDDATVKANVQDARSNRTSLDLVRSRLPVAALAAGVVLLVAGFALTAVRSRRGGSARAGTPDTRPSEAV